ncbi:MAG: MerR family DNA-binding transcriptional regulator [Actinobacteria bacterium]|nr:MerR family DNA-binding transcriptional regulator [Actinomycetota bacterium]MCB9388612.1 MerR family DNA-binding transcriptional regulator [Acidimicrobiia bacterium]
MSTVVASKTQWFEQATNCRLDDLSWCFSLPVSDASDAARGARDEAAAAEVDSDTADAGSKHADTSQHEGDDAGSDAAASSTRDGLDGVGPDTDDWEEHLLRGGSCSIGEVLGIIQDEFPEVTVSKIRFLEAKGLLTPERRPSGYRSFAVGDVRQLRWILLAQREYYLPLKVIGERIKRGEVPHDFPVVAGSTKSASTPRPPKAVPEWARDDDDPALPDALPTLRVIRGETASTSGDTAPSTTPPSAGPPEHGDALAGGGEPDIPAGATFTRHELAKAADMAVSEIEALDKFGLLPIATRTAGTDLYGERAVTVARLARQLLRFGLEARHLRMYRTFADREAALFNQLVDPLMRRRDAESHRQARARAKELARLGDEMRDVLLAEAMRDVIDDD